MHVESKYFNLMPACSYIIIEAHPLLDNDIQNPRPGRIYKLVFGVFYFLCSLTGQFTIIPTGWKDRVRVIITIWTVITTIIFVAVNILSLVFDVYIIAWCPYKYCGFISGIRHHKSTPLLNLTSAQNISDSSELGAVQPVNLTIFDDWQKTVLTTATVSGTISYLFMIYVLYSQYSVFKKCIFGNIKKCFKNIWKYYGEKIKPDSSGVLQSPFQDSEGNSATKLSPKQSFYFMAIFFINILVYSGMVALLFIIFAKSVDKSQKKNERIDASGLTFQLASQLCAIFSCFVFSKVAYSVRSTCSQKLPELFNKVEKAGSVNADDGNLELLIQQQYITAEDAKKGSRLHLLKVILKWYDRMLHTTLYPFGTWFAVHWILFTITAFMSISYVAEKIILELYGQEAADKKCHGEHLVSCRLRLAYVFLFALEHCILFLYPCFRAASVTTGYTTMIKKVSTAEWNKITLDEKEKFINYLKIQDCTFKISILCAKLSFGFYIAYFSIFVGILGVTLKLAL